MTFETFLTQHRYPFSELNTFYVYKDPRIFGGTPSCTIYRDCGEIDLRMSGFDGFLLSDLMNFEVLESWQEPNDGYTAIRVAVKVPKDEDDGKSSETNSNFSEEKEIVEKMGLVFEKMLLDQMKEVHERLDKVAEGLKDLGNSAKQNMQTAMDMVFEHNAAVFAGEKDPYYDRMYGRSEKCEENVNKCEQIVNKDGKSSETNSDRINFEDLGCFEDYILDKDVQKLMKHAKKARKHLKKIEKLCEILAEKEKN